jgi:hypothetical protein
VRRSGPRIDEQRPHQTSAYPRRPWDFREASVIQAAGFALDGVVSSSSTPTGIKRLPRLPPSFSLANSPRATSSSMNATDTPSAAAASGRLYVSRATSCWRNTAPECASRRAMKEFATPLGISLDVEVQIRLGLSDGGR